MNNNNQQKTKLSNQAKHIISVVSSLAFGIMFNLVTGGDDTPSTVAFSIFLGFIVDIFLSSNSISENNESIQEIKERLNKSDKFIKTLVQHRQRVDEIEGHLAARKDLVKELGSKVWNDYLESFEITERGIYLGGEELAINTAIKFWRMLSIMQSQNKSKPIIARTTHSNDISIWLPDEKSISNDLYTYQKQFIQYGGIIIRFLIGHSIEPDERYQKAIDNMKENGIDVRYFSAIEVGEKDFDFLYLRNENFVLKWYSGIKGEKIAGCFISDKAEEEIINRWATLYYKTELNGNPITSIPKDLQFDE